MERKRVVVIGTHWEAQMMATCALESAGYDAITLFDRRNALRAVRDVCPDLVLLDMGLPKLKAWQIARSIRRDARTRNVPIIGIVPDGERSDFPVGPGNGLIDVLSMTYDNRSLIRKVRKVLRDTEEGSHN